MKRSDLFFYVTNGSAGHPGDGTRGDAELIRAGSHSARLEWARGYMRAMGTENLVYWCPDGLTTAKELSWSDYAKRPPSDMRRALMEHKREMPSGTRTAMGSRNGAAPRNTQPRFIPEKKSQDGSKNPQ